MFVFLFKQKSFGIIQCKRNNEKGNSIIKQIIEEIVPHVTKAGFEINFFWH